MRDRVTVLAPAKLNLALDVVGILPGGYHALDMTMQAISLYERVVIHRSPYLDLTLPGSKVKPGPGNTAIKAALAFSTIRACWRVQTSPSIRTSPSGLVWLAAAPTLLLFWWV